MIKDSASFRDRSGYVFSREGKIYRWISPEYLPQYQRLMSSGLYSELVNRRLLIPNFPADRPTADSLNVAIATAITCAEFRRRHLQGAQK